MSSRAERRREARARGRRRAAHKPGRRPPFIPRNGASAEDYIRHQRLPFAIDVDDELAHAADVVGLGVHSVTFIDTEADRADLLAGLEEVKEEEEEEKEEVTPLAEPA